MIDVTALILGAGTLISTLGLGFLQYRLWKAQAKESESKAQTNLIDTALKISEREVIVVRQVNEDLNRELLKKEKRIEELEQDIEDKEQYIERLRTRLRQFEDTQPLRKEAKDDSSKDESGVQVKE